MGLAATVKPIRTPLLAWKTSVGVRGHPLHLTSLEGATGVVYRLRFRCGQTHVAHGDRFKSDALRSSRYIERTITCPDLKGPAYARTQTPKED